jgi:predicted ATP-dependent endonuclease of OLD family
MTTHSAIPLLELKWQDIRVVRSNGGRTEILSPGPDATEITKRVPSAFFARKVVVCEGPTEVGLIRNIEDRWAQDHEGRPLPHEGVEVVNGEGSNAPARAKALAALKYRVAFFGDSDKLRPTVKQDMLDSEITVIVWNGKASTEQRLARDLPVSGLRELIALGTELRCLESIRDSMAARLELIEKKAEVADPADLSAWLRLGANEERVREAVGLAAKEKEWFKTIEWGQRLGRLLEKHLADMPDTDLAQKLRTLESWCYGG